MLRFRPRIARYLLRQIRRQRRRRYDGHPRAARTLRRSRRYRATHPREFPSHRKPACGDGSVGITAESIAQNRAELVATLARLRAELPGRALLVQELLTGPEYTVGLIGNPAQGFQLLPVIEADYSRLPATLPQILAYDSKFRLDSPTGPTSATSPPGSTNTDSACSTITQSGSSNGSVAAILRVSIFALPPTAR